MVNPVQTDTGLKFTIQSTQSQQSLITNLTNCDSEPQDKQRKAAFNHMVQGYVSIQLRVKKIKTTF